MSDYTEYLERLSKSRNITPEEAETLKLTQEVKEYYEKVQRKEE